MTTFLYLSCYLAAIIFIAGCVARIVRYARMPTHLRWELYPVPHNEAVRVKHGGSSFEEADWWTKPASFSFIGELKFMLPEILFMKGLYTFNRGLWYCSFPFHFGLYLLAATLGLLFIAAAGSITSPGSGEGPLLGAIQSIYPLAGAVGMLLAILGALGLLLRRLFDESLRTYTTAGDIFNLVFFLTSLGTLSAAVLRLRVPDPDILAIARGMITFDNTLPIPNLLAAGLVLVAGFVAYIPLTHMSHFIAKFFTYHLILWDDASLVRDGKLQARMAECLACKPTWSAAHWGADGKRTWAQISAARPAREAKK